MNTTTPLRLYGAVVLACVCLILAALGLQHLQNLEPCPLCILQRYAFFGIAIFAAVAALTPRIASMCAAMVGLLFALVGIGTGIWHIRLQLSPPEVASCGPGLEYLVSNLPLSRALPRIFQGGADCAEITWRFLGLTLPMWSVVWLVILGAVMIWALAKSRKTSSGKTVGKLGSRRSTAAI